MKPFLPLLAFILSYSLSFGQNFFEVLGRPTQLDKPTTITPNNFDQEIGDKNPRNRSPWFVICDRQDTKVYEKVGREYVPDAKKRLKFGEYYYVVAEDGPRIRIGKAALDSRRIEKGSYSDIGWVYKKDVLLWAKGLRNERTLINKKAFLLNSVEAINDVIRQKDKKIVDIYNGPESGQTMGEKTIYEFYFVLKTENNRYLLSKEANLSTQLLEVNNPIVGWVLKSRVAEWNTRLAMEPNYEEPAFNERKTNPKLRVAAYGDEEAAENHANGKPNLSLAYWESDPAALDPSKLAKGNPRRFNGSVVRLPILNTTPKYFTTGVIGEITVKGSLAELGKINEVNYSALNASLDNIKNVRENFNVVFVIEGTSNLALYKEAIAVGIERVNAALRDVPNRRFAAVVYRDIPEAVDKRMIEIKPLTSKHEDIATWLRQVQFARWRDNDPWTVLNKGIHSALTGVGLNKSDTNIIIVIGENGDFSADALRMAKDGKNEANIAEEALTKRMCEFNAHLFTIQCRNNGDLAGRRFVEQLHSLSLDNANCQYDLVRGVSKYAPDIEINGPEMGLNLSAQKIALEGGTMRAEINRPRAKSTFSEAQVKENMEAAVLDVFGFVDSFWKKLSKIVDEGASYTDVSSGGLSSAAIAKVMATLRNGSGTAYTVKDMDNLLKDKYRLYAQVFVPRKIEGASFPAFSQVLFMPKEDLEDYIQTLRQLANAYDGTPDEKRKALFDTLVELLKQYTGDSSLKSKSYKNTSTGDLSLIMQGLSGEGLDLSSSTDKRNKILISDFMDRKETTDQEINDYVKGILERTKTLEGILKQGAKYEFAYRSSEENIYFWIPLEITF